MSNIELQLVTGATDTIPSAPKPADNGDIRDPAQYIPRGMSQQDRAALREAALEWAETLGGNMAHMHPTKRPAAVNMNHFLDQEGRDKVFTPGQVDDMQRNLQETPQVNDKAFDKALVTQFLELIKTDMQGRSAGTVRCYLARNIRSDSPLAGSNWFGVTVDRDSSWYYAVGSFYMSYGARAARARGKTIVAYRLAIYDRYNWDIKPDGVSKAVTVSDTVEYALDQDEIAGAAGLEFRPDQPYFEKAGEQYILTDALFGSLVATGDAQHFDMVGTGSVFYAVFPDAATTSQSAVGSPTTAQHPATASEGDR